MKKLVVLLCLVMAGSVAAQPVDTDPDHVGIYFDVGATLYTNDTPLMYQPNPAYLVLTNVTSNGVLGWEMTIAIDPLGGYSSIQAVTPRGSAVDADGSALGFAVGLGSPLPNSVAIVLADITYFYTGPLCLYLGLPSVQSIPGHMAYIDGEDVGLLKPMYPSSGDFALPVATVGGGCEVTATRESTWGGVKTLFR